MRVIAVANQKGGTGKTAAAVNVSAALAEQGERVLLIDLDPQGNATQWVRSTPPEPPDQGAHAIFSDAASRNGLESLTDRVSLGSPGSKGSLGLVPSSRGLLFLDKRLAAEIGAELRLRQALERTPSHAWDWCFIDCPPGLGIHALNALAAAQELLVPVELHPAAIAGLAALEETVERVRDAFNPQLRIGAVLPSRVRHRTNLTREALGLLRKRYGKRVLGDGIRETIRVPESNGHGQPVTIYAPRSPAANEFRQVARLLKRRSRK